VKKNLRIVAGILAMYILSLPVILNVHAQSHSLDVDVADISILDSDIVTDDVNCEICSFYFDQQLYSNDFQYDCHFNNYTLTSYNNIVQLEVTSSYEQYYLRGPPLV